VRSDTDVTTVAEELAAGEDDPHAVAYVGVGLCARGRDRPGPPRSASAWPASQS
jgi:hypothetical protein